MALAGKKKIFDGRYEILGIVGRGSRSVVYHAKNIEEGSTEVALKVLLDIKRDKLPTSEKLRREALAMVSSHHKYVVRLDDFHSVGDLCYLSMEYAPESDLRKYLEKIGGTLPPQQLELFFTQIAEAIEYVHKVGIIHRDVKPDNLLVVNDKNIRLGDFGVALLPGDDSSPEDLKNAVGTMDYMAPEVLQGTAYDQKSDIYSFALTFYEMACGKHPFSGASLMDQINVRRDENVPPLSSLVPGCPEYLSDVIRQAMSFEPSKRFASMKELLQHLSLKKIQRQSPTLKAPQPAPKETSSSTASAVATPSASPRKTEPKIAPPSPAPKMTAPERRTREIPAKEILESAAAIESKMTQAPEPAPVEPESPSKIVDHPMKASRESRAPTVFITKELTDKVRKDAADAAPQSRPLDSVAPISLKTPPTINRSSGNPFKLIGIGVLAFLALNFVAGLFRGDSSTPTPEAIPSAQESAAPEARGPVLPQYAGAEIVFPSLPAGTFVGRVDGMIPEKSIPLTIISSPRRRSLTFIIGIDGWQPATVSLDAAKEESLRITSNGLVFDIRGQTIGGVIEGAFVNAITGEAGSWSARPARSRQ